MEGSWKCKLQQDCTSSDMDLSALPVTVQRRIALLLDQPEATSNADHVKPKAADFAADQAPIPAQQADKLSDTSTSGWELACPLDDVIRQLRSPKGSKVLSRAFANNKLQASEGCSLLLVNGTGLHFVYMVQGCCRRRVEQKLRPSCMMQFMLGWAEESLFKLGKTLR